MAYNAAAVTPITRGLTTRLNHQFARRVTTTVRAILRNEQGFDSYEVNNLLRTMLTSILSEQSLYDHIALQGYVKARENTETINGKPPTLMTIARVVGPDTTAEIQRLALKRWSDFSSGRELLETPKNTILDEMKMLVESAGADRVARTARAIAAEDTSMNKTNFGEGQIRTIRIPRPQGCDFCKMSAYRNDGISSFHKGCTCAATTVFPDQVVESSVLDEGRAKYILATEYMRGTGITTDSNSNLMKAWRELEKETDPKDLQKMVEENT